MEPQAYISAGELSHAALRLAGESVAKLARWLALYELRLAEAEAAGVPPDLKDMVAFLTAAKRALEIARLAEAIGGGDSPQAENPLAKYLLDNDE